MTFVVWCSECAAPVVAVPLDEPDDWREAFQWGYLANLDHRRKQHEGEAR